MDLKYWALTLFGILFSGAFLVFARVWQDRGAAERRVSELEYEKEKADVRKENHDESVDSIIARIRKRLSGNR